MSARQSTCHHTAAIEDALALEALAPAILAHAESCPSCADALSRKSALATITARVRRAHEQAVDLDPAAWARIRSAVDSRRASFASWRAWLIGVAAVAAGTAAILWMTAAPETTPRDEPHIAAPAPTPPIERPAPPKASPQVAQTPTPPPAASMVSSPPDAVALDVGPDALITAASDGERYLLIGRHTLELDRGARLRVRSLDPSGVELDLLEGLASFDVDRAPDERLFRVHAGDVSIEVRGTFWSVERRATDVVVSVERGKVAVMRDGEDEVLVEAGERVVFPRTEARVEPAPKAQRPKRPRPERMVEVDVGHSSAKPPPTSPEIEHLIPPILGAVRAGRCVQALSALEQVSRAVDGRLPRSAVWLTAWCQRKLGNIESSRRLFARYGSGPWPVPVGDELPPLPR